MPAQSKPDAIAATHTVDAEIYLSGQSLLENVGQGMKSMPEDPVVILDNVTRGRQEMKRLHYLGIEGPKRGA